MEYVIVNGVSKACSSVTTGSNSISFTVAGGDIEALKTEMSAVTELQVSTDAESEPYGEYTDLVFESAIVYANEDVTVVMHILTVEERRISALEVSQAEQDIVIAKSMFGGESE